MFGRTFLRETSIPGVSHTSVRATAGGGAFRTLLWVSLSVCGVCLTSWQMKSVIADYLRYPVSTTVMVEDDGDLPFPAVTVCPVNRVRCSGLMASLEGDPGRSDDGRKRELYCAIAFHAGCLRWIIRDAKLTGGANETARKKEELSELCPDHDADAVPWNSLEAEMQSMQEVALNQAYSSLDPEERRAIGMNPEEMLKECRVAAEDRHCGEVFNVTVMNTVARGNCFILNSRGEIGEAPGGPSGGLFFGVLLSRHEYPWRPANDEEGIRVVLHRPNTDPLPDEAGMDLQPGTSSRIAVEVHRLLRQPSPYPSHCVRLWNETRLGSVMTQSSLGGRAYGQTCCSRLCRLNWIADRCDCIWHQYDDLNMKEYKQMIGHTPSWYCAFDNQTQQKCIKDNARWYDREFCDCRPSCNDVTFRAASVSSLRWPGEAAWAYRAHEYGAKYLREPITSAHLSLTEEERFSVSASVRSDLVRVHIFLDSTKETVIREMPKYPDFYSLFTSLGGAMSVWMGVSFLVLAEAVELAVDVAVAWMDNKKK